MSNRITWSELAEYAADLSRLPTALVDEATALVYDAANGTADAIRAAYPSRSGDLRNGVAVRPGTERPFTVSAIVENLAPLAWIFENGSQTRQYVTKRGVKHLTGRMPPGHVFIPRVIRGRRALDVALAAMVTRHGLTVTADSGLAA